VRYAVGVAAVYGIVAASYILISSTMAADASRTVEDLRRLETLKGIAFVTVTSALVFAGAFAALRRMERDGEALLRRERALVEAEGRVFSGLIAATVAHDANNVLMAVLASSTNSTPAPTPTGGPRACSSGDATSTQPSPRQRQPRGLGATCTPPTLSASRDSVTALLTPPSDAAPCGSPGRVVQRPDESAARPPGAEQPDPECGRGHRRPGHDRGHGGP
jgi:hypothetical protein